ncbi:protection of telomeres protein 1 isoform X2 [Sceloporus undulatus]|uniref:protection of telomeres protein 1 isoform X2 n=1 Tax=Sceloporus undulatus TaxID=8520 RepID=UPI001C4A9661|nr:protection of telomeres protein 1 isoform X2 [Sceloporus undulatus]
MMPVQVVKGSLRVLKKALPRNLRRVEPQDLQLGQDYAEVCFQGTVVIICQLTTLGNGTSFFKIVLQGSEDSSSTAGTLINTLVFGKLAEDCSKHVHKGDTVVVAGFGLAKSINDDGRHGCHLEVSDEAGSTIYICTRPSSTRNASETVAMPVVPKYTYTPLNNLKDGTVVNLYGAVKFFKPPYACKGTDYCSVVTLVDQSNTKLICTLFNTNKDALPQIYRNGDIVRFHRIKVREFSGQMQGITSIGFAALTFDGTIGTPVVPRTSSKGFTFTDEDRKTVEDMRIWVASNFPSDVPSAKLCAIQPPMFFEFICQLVGKAKVDGYSYLLKVWDGTKCPFPSWKVLVKEDDIEGDGILIHRLRNLTVDIVVYDNHVKLAKSLKVGNIIKMYNLHVKTHIPEDKPEVSYLQFHLHGGTGYGRGIIVLQESETDVKEFKAFLDSVDLTESEHSERPAFPELETTYSQLGYSLDRCQQLSITVLTDHQHLDVTALNTIINSRSPQQYRVRAKLRRFEPVKLHQSVKLHCPMCNSLQEVPDGPQLDLIIQEASASRSNIGLQSTSFCESVLWDIENQGQCSVAVHFVEHAELLQNPEDSLILLEGGKLKEILKLSKRFKGIIPVRSTEDSLVLLDLSVPFFWQGNLQYYGCKHCSNPKAMSNLGAVAAQEDPSWDSTTIAQALGVVPLQYVFVMKFTLDDGTGLLDAYLMDCEKFFQMPASEVLINNIFQENMEKIMEKLCPAGKNLDELPWLECFIKSYYVRDETEERLCYRIFDTMIAEDV